jgi:hypothetical protein
MFVCTGADSLGLEVQNVVDISDQVNYELAMRISSSIKNGDDFYTDLNGLQVCRVKLQILLFLNDEGNIKMKCMHNFIMVVEYRVITNDECNYVNLWVRK